MIVSSATPLTPVEDGDTPENVYPSPVDDDQLQILSSSSSSDYQLPNQRQITFDRALGQMLTRHYYLLHHEFVSFDRFEGWIYTYSRHRYKIVISYYSSCSCQGFRRNSVCKHLLFVLKRVFNADLYSPDLRLSIMLYRQFTIVDLEQIFQGQTRRLCPIVTPVAVEGRKENSPPTFKRQSIDGDDVCPICFERLLIKNRKIVTCFHSCGKSMHESCMKEWKRVKGKSTSCPLCQARWMTPSTVEQAVLTHYSHRCQPVNKRERYILCCLYTPPDWC